MYDISIKRIIGHWCQIQVVSRFGDGWKYLSAVKVGDNG